MNNRIRYEDENEIENNIENKMENKWKMKLIINIKQMKIKLKKKIKNNFFFL